MVLSVYNSRFRHNDDYDITRTPDGWRIEFMDTHGRDADCDTRGHPALYANLDQDSINYPAALGGYLDFLWRKATAHDMAKEQVQEALDLISEWLQTIEQSKPAGIFAEYR
ncbi:MAG TPA: hypothetical protein DGT21_07575 [Armatimonadetes bacterium]|jgi:hypothetical protein|nr:hypothetical protein [Armatimonadota bacterium]